MGCDTVNNQGCCRWLRLAVSTCVRAILETRTLLKHSPSAAFSAGDGLGSVGAGELLPSVPGTVAVQGRLTR
jgi:hypothetical protein